jgi:hypothetical protein
MTRRIIRMLSIFFAAFLLPAFAGCKQQVVPFKLPSAYPNVTEVADAQIAAQAYEDATNAEAAFGFDIRGAEILPVKVIFDNRERHSLEIVASQTFLAEAENNQGVEASDPGSGHGCDLSADAEILIPVRRASAPSGPPPRNCRLSRPCPDQNTWDNASGRIP